MAAAVPDDVNAYILAMKEGDAAAKFYQLAESIIGEEVDNTPRVIAANKAYYVSNAAATAAFTLSFDGTTTGIDAVEAADGAEKATIYYDLSGRRVLYPSNGIFVTADGQKVFIK